MKAARADRWDHQARPISRTLGRGLPTTMVERSHQYPASAAKILRVKAAQTLRLPAEQQIRESFGCPKAQGSLIALPHDRHLPWQDRHQARRAVNRRDA